jgi:predicted ribosome quality control (RQC) complex YloA/Tae2 family protein
MKTQLNSMDMHFLLLELKEIKDSKVDRIYNNGKENFYFQFFKSNEGKKLLRVIVGKALFLTETKTPDETPSEFCALLRNKLEGKFLDSIVQLEPERILKLIFKSKEDTYFLYIESFGGGNIILCNSDGIILNSLTQHKFKDRNLFPKEKYKYPAMQHNVFDLNKKEFSGLIKDTEKEKIVTCLAVDLGLGGIYSEEACLLSSVDKNTEPKKISDKEISNMLNSVKKIISSKIIPEIIYENKAAIDVVPIKLELYKDSENKEYASFNEALDSYFTKELKIIPKKESAYTKQIEELKRIIEEQKATIDTMKLKENELRDKGELIYTKYQLVKEILDEINKASKKYSWQEIKEKLKGHKIIKEINLKDKTLVVEI